VLAQGEAEWVSLLNGKDLDGWSTTIMTYKVGEDPDKLVQVHDGMVHMYKDLDPGKEGHFGVITHKDTFSRFHLMLDYKWLEKKFKPRADRLRDAGILYHVKEHVKVWPDSLECQIQEGDTGDIVLLQTGAFSWKHPKPDNAPKGQGEAHLLPEHGGYPYYKKGFAYLGRLSEPDQLKGWNTVEVIVQADESAVHIVNGKLLARMSNMVDIKGKPLRSGKICLQLEAAELVYRDVQIRKLPEPLKASQKIMSLSAVVGVPSQKQTITVKNPHSYPVDCKLVLSGKDAAMFKLGSFPEQLAAGESRELTVEFSPGSNAKSAGRFSAGLQIGWLTTGTHVVLQGIALEKFEGKNEPTLQQITRAFGIPVDVGGGQLHLDTKKATIGGSVPASYFEAVDGKKVIITPLARFSPKGEVSIGMIKQGGTGLISLGKISDVNEQHPDAHQRLLPPLISNKNSISFSPDTAFAIYIQGKKYQIATDPKHSKDSRVKHGARVYPVSFFQGRRLENAYLIGFEEASNGDYQDGLLLIENIRAN
jgi:hypothetical protein